MNAQGNQWVTAGTSIAYAIAGGEDRIDAERAAVALDKSQHLRNALWLNGRANRNAADFYMIYEYATREFGGEEGVAMALGFSRSEQKQLTQSANNLSPLDGGRHVGQQKLAPWPLGHQTGFIAEMLRRWIERLAHEPAR